MLAGWPVVVAARGAATGAADAAGASPARGWRERRAADVKKLVMSRPRLNAAAAILPKARGDMLICIVIFYRV